MRRVLWTHAWRAVLFCALFSGGCAWQRGRADKKTLRQSVYELWKTKPHWTRYIDFHKYVNEHKQFIQINGFRLCYVEKGQGECVILLHGLFGSKNVWRSNFMTLAEHFRTVAIDEPGAGDSDNPHQSVYRYNPEHLAKTTLEVMDRLNIKEAHLVGNSLGGMIALQIARDHPKRVKSLVLIAPAVWDYYGKIVKAGGLAFGFGPALATARPTAEFGNALLNDTVYNQDVLTEADRYYAVKSLMQNGARNALIEKSRELFNGDYLRKVSKTFTGLRTRTLILWGEKDTVLPPLIAHRLYEQLPNSEILFIPFCGHHPQEEVPRIVNEEVLWFISGGKLGQRCKMR
ncbi:MAG: alpha/beta hydrolase [Planctomycetes bacterium]|nr:alpha/beta hydrolase [Planctomycetota bacterium]